MRGVFGIMEDPLVGGDELRVPLVVTSRVQVPVVLGEGSRRYHHPKAVPRRDDDTREP